MSGSIRIAAVCLLLGLCGGCGRGDVTSSSSAPSTSLSAAAPSAPSASHAPAAASAAASARSNAAADVASPVTAEAQQPLLPKRTATSSPAKVTLGKPKIQGAIAEQDVSQAVARAYGRFLLCYETDLVQTPTLDAKASIQFKLGPEGRPIDARVTSTTPSLNNCLRDAVSTVPFPAQAEPASVTVPVQFKAGARTVVEPAIGELTLQGTPLRNTTTTHVERALERAGCTNVGKNARKSPSEPTYLTAKLEGARVDVSFRDIFELILLPDQAAALRKDALVFQNDGLVLTVAIEGDADRRKAAALLAQMLTVNTRAPTAQKQRRAPEEQER